MVRIYGRLGEAAARDLDGVCRETRGPLVLDVTYLMSADDAGIAMLRRLTTDGVPITGVSPYVKLLLEPDET